MKKIIALLLLMTFCTEAGVFASTINNPNQMNTSSTSQMNMQYQYQGTQSQNVSSKLRQVQNEEVQLNTNAFSNNYQTSLQTNQQTLELSPIEKLFNGKESEITGTPLQQVGYDLFTSTTSSVNGTAGKFDNNYKLSIGEKVNVYLYGDSIDVMAISGANLLNPTTKTEVDSKGSIFIQGVGLVKAENRTISEVENEANRLASQKYKSIKVKLTVASGQEFSVFVYGQVNRPGKILVGNNSSIIDALNAAGGVKKTGTLRNITYTSNNKSKNVDIYKALFSGNDDGIILRPNDKIFVDRIGDVVAIKNGVTVPGIYEIKNGENLQKIITFAGGLLPATQVTEVTLTGYDANSKQRTAENIAWNEAKNTKLKSGDAVEFRELYNTAENIVTIQGNVKHPATYAYKEGMRLSDILKSEDELLEETFINQAVIRRISGKDNSIETIPVFLKEFFAGMNDPVLKPNSDRIKSIPIMPEDKIFFRTLRGNEVMKTVKVSGFVKKPGVFTFVEGKRLKDMIEMAGGLTSEADLRGVVFKRTNLQGKQVELAHKNNERDIKLIEGRMASAYKPTEGDQKSKMEMLEMLKADDLTLATKYNGQIALNIKSNDLDKIRDLDNIEVQDGDDIYIPRTSNHVSVIGEVYNEQSFVYKKGSNAKYYIKEVGGYTPNANKFRLYKVSVNGRAEKISNHSDIEPGDTIVVPRRIAGNDWITPVCDTLKGIASIIVMAFAINKW